MSVGYRRALQKLALVLALVLGASGLSLNPALAQPAVRTPSSTLAPLGPETTVPFGWVDFCRRYKECDVQTQAPQAINLTTAAFRKLDSINALVNNSIEPVSDSEHAGVVDAWDYPSDGKGDCEDFALLKRRLLIEAGFPRGALLLTVVKDEHGDGHSVLMVRTTRGDFVLDNLVD
jgi:predicted transglutaminase-like cysteine proteinase